MYGDLGHPQHVVLHVALGDDLPIAPVILLKALYDFPHKREIHYFTMLNFEIFIFAFSIFANHAGNAGHGRTTKIIAPVELNEGGQDDWHGQLHFVGRSIFARKVYVENCGALIFGFCPNSAKHPAVDIEVGIIQGIFFFRCNLVGPGGGWIDRL
ncbi:hypothetical protein SDC9_111248 [bioreactor metagenome]|uniref:Uncharacterized protein n=1 Tax=bioreactor metagenome TaxID=1076179 RepID=A0A645BG96_9ZZZZ